MDRRVLPARRLARPGLPCYAAAMQLQQEQMVVVLKGSLPDLKRARETLEETGIDAEIVRPPGCKTNS